MKRILVLGTALVATAAPVAYAGGLEVTPAEPVVAQPAPALTAPVEPLYSFDGLSLGIQGGKAWVDTENPEADGEGGTYGLRAYYDRDLGNVIVGGGLQYDRANIDLDGAAEVESVLRVGPRVGLDLNRNMVYGTAGYAKAFTEDGALSVGDSGGYFAGIGYEVFLTEDVTAGTEVVYHKFDDFDGGLEAEATTANVSLNYRF
ncbi:outer membrane protein [Roseivivax sp. CAU 1761]